MRIAFKAVNIKAENEFWREHTRLMVRELSNRADAALPNQ